MSIDYSDCKEKKYWEIVIFDRELRLQLVKEGILPGSAGDPSLRLILHCVKPDMIFILKKFKEYLIKNFKHGFIDPVVRINPAMTVLDHETYFEL